VSARATTVSIFLLGHHNTSMLQERDWANLEAQQGKSPVKFVDSLEREATIPAGRGRPRGWPLAGHDFATIW
jgi:hypothetical protein